SDRGVEVRLAPSRWKLGEVPPARGVAATGASPDRTSRDSGRRLRETAGTPFGRAEALFWTGGDPLVGGAALGRLAGRGAAPLASARARVAVSTIDTRAAPAIARRFMSLRRRRSSHRPGNCPGSLLMRRAG